MLARLYQRAIKLSEREDGNIAMLTALVVIPLVLLTGFAVDYQYATSNKRKVQTILDAAVINGARALQAGESRGEVRSIVQAYFAQHLAANNPVFVSCPSPTVRFLEDFEGEDGGGVTINDIRAEVTCGQKTTLAAVGGRDQISFRAASGSTFGTGEIDVAFVFDVSGSMSGTRNAQLRTAAAEAVRVLIPESEQDDSDIRIAMTAYNHQLNLGPYFEAITGDTFERMYQIETDAARVCDEFRNNGSCRTWRVTSWETEERNVSSTCAFERAGPQAYTDAPPDPSDPSTYLGAGAPVWFFDAPDWKKQRAYNGAVHTGGGPFVEPSNTAFSERYDLCPSDQLLPLTTDRTALDAYVGGLGAARGTSGSLGLAMGWYLISPRWAGIWPEDSEPLAYDQPDATKVVILMTDGIFDDWMAEGAFDGWALSDPEHDDLVDDGYDRAGALCDAMKGDPHDVIVYTIAFGLSDTDSEESRAKDELAACATSASHAFEAADGDELTAAYRAIAISISDLRLNR